MFGQVLDKLDSYFGRAFLLARYVPWLLCLAANLVIAAIEYPAFRASLWADLVDVKGESAAILVIVLLAVWVLAYASSPVVEFIIGVLEGRDLWDFPRRLLVLPHAWRREFLDRRTDEKFESLAESDSFDRLIDDLADARRAGRQWRAIRDAAAIARAASLVGQLSRARQLIEPIALERLQAAARALAAALRENCAEAQRLWFDDRPPAAPTTLAGKVRAWLGRPPVSAGFAMTPAAARRLATTLASLHRAMWSEIIPFAKALSQQEDQRAAVERNRRFAPEVLAPTRLGNEAAALRSYCETRYGIDFDFFWPRFLLVARNDQKLSDALSSAKIQVDFSVLVLTLSIGSLLAWAVALFVGGTSALTAAAVIGVGPLAVGGWLGLVHASYAGFADVVRAAIDLHRFDVLAALRQPLPVTSQGEALCWDGVQRLSLFDEHRANVTFRHPSP